MSGGYTLAMKAQYVVLGVLVGSTAFAAMPLKPLTVKLPFTRLERCPASVHTGFETLELKVQIQPSRARFNGPAQIQPIPLARPLESKVCPIPLTK